MSPLSQRLLESPEISDDEEMTMTCPDLREIASELKYLNETILQRLG